MGTTGTASGRFVRVPGLLTLIRDIQVPPAPPINSEVMNLPTAFKSPAADGCELWMQGKSNLRSKSGLCPQRTKIC